MLQMSAVETGWMSALATEDMSAAGTGQIETRHMSAAETGQMSAVPESFGFAWARGGRDKHPQGFS